MRSWTKRTVSAALALAVAAPPLWAADSCPGGCLLPPSNSHYVSTPGPTPIPAFPAAILTATLKKGKKKRVVVVEAAITTGGLAPGAPTALGIMGDVNGVPMQPVGAPFGIMEDCGGFIAQPPTGSCTVTGTFWLDIDANPALINVPLTVTLLGGQTGVPVVGLPAVASMSVRLEKK